MVHQVLNFKPYSLDLITYTQKHASTLVRRRQVSRPSAGGAFRKDRYPNGDMYMIYMYIYIYYNIYIGSPGSFLRNGKNAHNSIITRMVMVSMIPHVDM